VVRAVGGVGLGDGSGIVDYIHVSAAAHACFTAPVAGHKHTSALDFLCGVLVSALPYS
jgi:UDP-glucose 4-epimerase